MIKSDAVKENLEFAVLFLTALSETLLLMFYSIFDNKLLINILIVIIPVIFCTLFYLRYRKTHYQQIYSKEELKKQNRA